MIRINKSVEPDTKWRRRARAATKRLCDRFTADSQAYVSGTRHFEFDGRIYGDASIKALLRSAQYDKCCYCEMVVGASGDVEHFRPKGDVRQDTDETVLTPGYYWLAYDWLNLFLSCSTCNQRHKKSLFPLAYPQVRARSHDDGELLSNEQPLIIHPCLDDPEEHIGFRAEIAFPRPVNGHGSVRGEQSIRVFDLNRPDLRSQRRRTLERTYACLALVKAVERGDIEIRTAEGKKLLEDAIRHLSICVGENEQFASMSRCALKSESF